VESKRPLTRSVLDIRIAEVQSFLDDAISRKAFEECSPLQHKLEKLIRQREELPTIDEMKEIVRLAKQGVSDAASRRDFARAATAQAALDKAIAKLEDVMKSEGLDIVDEIVLNDRFQSRADLESAILEASKKVDNAISKKAFSKATKYQSELDELESLRKTLPSVNEIESELNEVKAQMNDAIKDKNFKNADCLQNDIDKLEAKLEVERAKMKSISVAEDADPCTQFINENGETVTFTSRFELEKEMNRFQFLVHKSTSLRKFKEAAKNQKFLETLDKLKPLLPTEQELRNDIAKIRTEMESAIQKKDFDTAEKLDKTVVSLEQKLAAERISIPQSFDALDTASVSIVTAPPSVVKAPIKAPLRNSTNAGSSSASSVNKLSSDLAHPFAKSTPVSKLRPKAPMISTSNDTVLSVVQMLASKRGDAAIITNSSGELAGIITDTDVTRRVVAKDLNASRTSIADVMTPNPSCVTMSDSATDALVLMVENRFRHLPVTGASGSVVGVLDIAKCLNDAISKLEHSKDKGSSAAEEALNATLGAAGGGAHAAALRQLLGPLMSQAFGGQTAPTLRTVLAGIPSTIVSPSTSIQETGHKMAEARKAALVVENGRLIGIFGFKDMMTRAVAKELPLEFTAVSTVMTPNPESVSPDTTVLEALQIMHDNKFLTLPVCESNGSVIGVVDVMDCVYGSGGAEGWRSIFAKAMDCDDLTDLGSVCSNRGGSVYGSIRTSKSIIRKNDTPVSKLRPKAPMISTSNDTVLSVVQMLASKRGDAAIITNSSGELAGIITDTDVTRRVVAKDLNASRTSIADVMTPNPSCVTMSDSATDALVLMVENRFRHLPVTGASGSVVGVLDIAKCLNDAISKLEHSKDKGSSAAEEALNATLGAAGGGAHAAALRQLLGPLMSQAFGGQTAPTLRTVLAGIPSTIVSPSTSIQETGHKMAEARKAALVVENGRLIGIFGFKDMMTRAVAKELPLEFTAVSTVMTPNPESVSPDTTVLEALQIMHDNKFLTLPVCESNGSVIGVVDVMDCVYGSGGAEGWRSIFAKAMDCDDLTDSASVPSRQVKSAKSGSVSGSVARKKDDRPVSKLRPKKPILMSDSESVLSIAQVLAAKRGDAALIFNVNGGLAGIITDTDVTRRVVAKHLPARLTKVSDAMTANPTCVLMSDSAMEALCTMVDNRFRHLPVIDANGNIVGCLDIAKCLNDAISKLERAQDKSGSAAQVAVKQMSFLPGTGGSNQAATLQALLGPLLAHVLGGKSSPTLRSVLAGRPSNIVSPNSSLQDVGFMMAEARKAALVVESDKLVGIFGFKDMMTRAVAKELPLDSTPVSAVMTPNPEYVSPEITVLEALQIMHDNKFLTLPVCEDDGRVIGLVDVMDCVHASGGAEGWKSLFASALDEDDDSSVFTNDRSEVRPLGIPLQVEIGKRPPSDDDISESLTLHNPISAVESRAARSAVSADLVVYKVVDDVGQTYVIRAGTTIESINKALDGKIPNFDPSTAVFKYVDDEGDDVFIKSDECVEEAVSSSVQAGNKNVKLSIKSRKNPNKTFLVAGGAGFVAVVGVALMILLKPKK